MDLLLGIDLGTTNCRAILFAPDGRQLAVGSQPTPTYHPRPEWTEHDPEQLWLAIAACIREALHGIDPQRVRGLAVTSVAEAGVLVDQAGRPLAPMIAWHDGRTTPEVQRWQAQVDQAWADSITALQARPIASLFKLQWLRDNLPAAYAGAARWLLAADYIAFRLTGEQASDYSLASRTLLFDMRARRWSLPLVEAAGLRADLLPPLMPSGMLLGHVTAAASQATGLRTGTPVAVGGHDHIVGAFAAGIVRAGQCLDSLGTAEATFLPLDSNPPLEATTRTGCTFGVHVARERVFLLDGLLSGGAALVWARNLLTPSATNFDQLEALASTAPPGSRGAVFLPRLVAGERGGFVGVNLATGQAELARAIYEGLAYGWRELLEHCVTAAGVVVEQITLIGGGTRSAIWVQTKANVLNQPLHVLAVSESVALGAAMLGGIAAGVYRDEADALASVQLTERIIEPEPHLPAQYEEWYRQRFLPLRPALMQWRSS